MQIQTISKTLGTEMMAETGTRIFGRTLAELVLVGTLFVSVASAANGFQSWQEFGHPHFWVSSGMAFGTALVAYAKGREDGKRA
jgi:hypothetical protein